MKEEFVTVYRGASVSDAQTLADRLKAVGIESFVDDTESPLYGANLGPRSRLVRVRSPMVDRALEVVREFEREGHPGIPEEEWSREETGLELPRKQRPPEDSPSDGLGGGITNQASEDPTGEKAPEDVDNSELADHPLGGKPVRDGQVEADVERPEVEEAPIDELDVSELFSTRRQAREGKHRPPGSSSGG